MIAEETETEKIATPGVLLYKDKMGGIRIGQTKVLLDWVVEGYNKGDSPEQIQERFPLLQLADVYMVIGYYLNSKTEIDAYIEEGIRHAQEMQQKLNELKGGDARERLRRRLKPHLYQDVEPQVSAE